MIDYRELLKKYMRHVVESEGIDFVDHINQYSDSVKFSNKEEAELRKIAQEKLDE